MKLGINSYTFMWSVGVQGANPEYPDRSARPRLPLSAVGLLEKARSLGVRLVQTGPNLPVEELPEAEIETFIQTAKAWGIELELGTRGLEADHMQRQIALAMRMGAQLIRTLPEFGGEYTSDIRLIAPAVRKILPILEGENIRLALENISTSAAELSATIDEIGSPYVGIVLDLVNSLAVPEGWKEVTRNLARHTMCLHYKDFTIRRLWHMMGFICGGAPSGKGMVDPVWLFAALKASPYDYNVIIEQWAPEQPDVEAAIAIEQQWAVESVAFLRQYIQD
jgi:sugar phosphate isomerase/epimerase